MRRGEARATPAESRNRVGVSVFLFEDSKVRPAREPRKAPTRRRWLPGVPRLRGAVAGFS